MADPAPYRPRIQSLEVLLAMYPDGCTARFLVEQLGSRATACSAAVHENGRIEREPRSRKLSAPSLAARPVAGRHASRNEEISVVSGLPIQPVKCVAHAARSMSTLVLRIPFRPWRTSPNSGLRPSDTRSHGFQRNFSLSSDPPFPTSTEMGCLHLERAGQCQSVARGDWPRNAGIP